MAGRREWLLGDGEDGATMSEMDYAARMAKLLPEQLAEIAFSGESDGFDTQAIMAAKRELESRNLDQGELERIEHQAEEYIDDKRHAKEAILPRSRWILIALIAPFGIIFFAVFIYLNYSSRGYKKKANESLKAAGLGYLFYFGIGAVFMLTDFYRS
jgi:hypothetical protein